MTKEEMKTAIHIKCLPSSTWKPDAEVIHPSDVLSLIEDCAKNQCIAFAEWLAVNGWYFNKIKRWSNRNESSDNLIEVLSATKTTEELYDKFLTEHQSK